MIRDIVTIVFIILIVAVGHFYIQNMISKDIEDINIRLENLKKEVDNNKTNITNFKNAANDIYQLWKKIEKRWAIIVEHQELDSIEKIIINVKSQIETNEDDTIISKIDEAIFLVSHIVDKEKIYLKNIF